MAKVLNTLHDSYKKVSGVVHGTDHEQLMRSMQHMQQEQVNHHAKIADSFQRLSDRILYAPNLQAIKDNNVSRRRQVDDLRQVRESLDPVQKALGGDLLSSAVIWTPDKMEQAFTKNPWEILVDTRPAAYASRPNNAADMVPFLFEQGGVQYIGWQTKGFISIAFNCEHHEIWTPSGSSTGGKTKKTDTKPAPSRHFDFPVPEMVVIPAGSFEMGSNKYDNEKPIHEVDIKCFAIGKYPITFEQWDACYQDDSCDRQPDDKGWGRGKRPVINISRDDAKQYLRWLSEKTGEPYRLPSEAEWEYATRAGTNTKYWWGNDLPCRAKKPSNAACFGQNSTGTEEVGSYRPNPFGLYDVHGNVQEWVEDKWHGNYKKAPRDGSVWESGSGRVLRGGSWYDEPQVLRAASRRYSTPDYRCNRIGFRPALGL